MVKPDPASRDEFSVDVARDGGRLGAVRHPHLGDLEAGVVRAVVALAVDAVAVRFAGETVLVSGSRIYHAIVVPEGRSCQTGSGLVTSCCAQWMFTVHRPRLAPVLVGECEEGFGYADPALAGPHPS